MNFFDLLRAHARERGQAVATSSPRHRLTSYRKLWSRIERGSARLQGEWLVEAGDVVAYAGHGHADALVLWLSLARLGAALLPLETPALLGAAGNLAERHGARLLLFDDELAAPEVQDDCACHFLSALIERPCHHEVRDCPEDPAAVSLLLLPADGAGEAQPCNIGALLHAAPPVEAWPAGHALFTAARLQAQVLPALAQGLPLALA